MFSFHSTTDASFYPCGEEQTVTWSAPVGAHNQQAAHSFNGGAPGPLTSQDLDQIFAPVLNDLAKTGFGQSGLEAASAGAFNPGYGYTPNIQDQYNHMNMNINSHTAWVAPTPPLTDSDTMATPASDATWDGILPLSTSSASETLYDSFAYGFAAAMPPPSSHAETAWQLQQGQSAHLTTPFVDGNGSMMGACFNFPNTFGATSGSAKPCAIPLALADTSASQDTTSGTYMPELPRTILRKRPRHAEETNDFKAGNDKNRRSMPRRVKRRTGMNGVLEAAGSTSRARQKPATEIPAVFNGKSEAAGRGAGMLAAPIAHEVYHQPLPGPSVQGVSVGTSARGQLPWIEGSECVAFDCIGHAVGQLDVVNATASGERKTAKKAGFRIPEDLNERNQRLLIATQEERARGIVRLLKCIVCPKSGFGNWDNFIRHCERTEAHPKDLAFCRYCGDFFSRPEARDRHEAKRPKQCFNVSPEKAEEKRLVTLREHEGYKVELEGFLTFGVKMGELFCDRIKRLFPDSSKRGSRQQNRLQK